MDAPWDQGKNAISQGGGQRNSFSCGTLSPA